MDKKITAPQMHRLEHDYNLSLGKQSMISESSMTLLNGIIDKLSVIKCDGDDEHWYFWVEVPRGKIEDFGDYEELHDFGDYDTYEEFEKAWKEWFPDSLYWYEIHVAAHKGYATVLINNSAVIAVAPDMVYAETDNFGDFLQFLNDEVDALIKSIKDGSYGRYVNSAMPYKYRTGIILRNNLWQIIPNSRKHDLGDLTEAEIKRFTEFYNEQDGGNTKKPKNRIKSMTAQMYYDICAICYTAARFEGINGRTPKAMYERFADDRDGGLKSIEDDSAEAFDYWYNLSDDKKWELQNSSHQWEISMGSTYTRIHLYVWHDEEGYYLMLAGGVHCRSIEVVRMYNAMREKDIPVVLNEHKQILNMLQGTDEVGIVPCSDNPSQYWYGGFPKSGVISFFNIDDDFTEEQTAQIIQKATWFNIQIPTLKSN